MYLIRPSLRRGRRRRKNRVEGEDAAHGRRDRPGRQRGPRDVREGPADEEVVPGALSVDPLQPPRPREIVLRLAKREDVDAPDGPGGRDDDHEDLGRGPHDVTVEGRGPEERAVSAEGRVAR